MVQPQGIEPCSSVLQTDVRTIFTKVALERVTRFELVPLVWKTNVLAIKHYTRNGGNRWTRTTPIRTGFTVPLLDPTSFRFPLVLRERIELSFIDYRSIVLPLNYPRLLKNWL